MSLSVKTARAAGGFQMARPYPQMGDPGLFGFLGKVVKGAAGIASKVLPGPLGTAAGMISRIGGGGSPGVSVVNTPPVPMIASGIGGGMIGGGIGGLVGNVLMGQGPGQTRPPGTITLGGTTITPGNIFPGGADFLTPAAGTAGACPSGYRPNKTSYFLKDGTFVQRGSRCVRRRRRNNLNPRALTKALGRVEGFKKATTRASRITVRKPKGCK